MQTTIALKENEERAIAKLKEVLTRKFNIVEMRLFGSKARGESTPESYLDVMIKIVEHDPDIISQIYDIIFDINLENDTFISTTIFSNKEIENGPMKESPIYKIIYKEGISI